MALSKDKKKQVVSEVGELLASSKLTVIARYEGSSVKALQKLRSQASDSGTRVRVVKNRLFKRALEQNDTFKGVDTALIEGQLLFAFNAQDEVAPAQNLLTKGDDEAQIEFVAALTSDGELLKAQDVQALANLPSKDQLRAKLIATVSAPSRDFASVLAANVRGLLNVLGARSETLGT